MANRHGMVIDVAPKLSDFIRRISVPFEKRLWGQIAFSDEARFWMNGFETMPTRTRYASTKRIPRKPLFGADFRPTGNHRRALRIDDKQQLPVARTGRHDVVPTGRRATQRMPRRTFCAADPGVISRGGGDVNSAPPRSRDSTPSDHFLWGLS